MIHGPRSGSSQVSRSHFISPPLGSPYFGGSPDRIPAILQPVGGDLGVRRVVLTLLAGGPPMRIEHGVDLTTFGDGMSSG